MRYTGQRHHRRGAIRAAFVGALLALGAAAAAVAAGTLDKVKESGRLTMGYASNARPFAYADASGKAAGYAVALCNKVADAVKSDLKLPALATEFVALGPDEAFRAVADDKVDLLCGVVPTLERRALVDFSIPIMLSGTSVAVRADAPIRLVQVLSGAGRGPQPTWRGSTDQAPQRAVVAVVGGMALEKELTRHLKERRIVAELVPVRDTAAGLQLLASRGADAFFGDRAMLLDAVAAARSSDVVVIDRLFRRDPVALAMRRNDGEFRLAVDRALSRLYRSGDVVAIYTSHFGAPTAGALDFFQLVALPD